MIINMKIDLVPVFSFISLSLWSLFHCDVIIYNVLLVSFFALMRFLSAPFFPHVCSISLLSARRQGKQLVPYVMYQYWVPIQTTH
jgi:hypothetical protein